MKENIYLSTNDEEIDVFNLELWLHLLIFLLTPIKVLERGVRCET